MKLSNTAFIIVYISVLLFILHFSSFCYLSINENLLCCTIEREARETIWTDTVGRLKPEMLLFSALGCDGIFASALQKKFHNLIPFSKAHSAKENQWNTGRIPGVPVGLANLWGDAAGWNVQKAQMMNEQKKKWSFSDGSETNWYFKIQISGSVGLWVQCKVKSENVSLKRRVLLVKLAWDSWQDLMCFVSLIIS